jgi:hypothetical protein
MIAAGAYFRLCAPTHHHHLDEHWVDAQGDRIALKLWLDGFA